MAESVDALVSNTSGATRPGSTPGLGTRTCKMLFSTLAGSFFYNPSPLLSSLLPITFLPLRAGFCRRAKCRAGARLLFSIPLLPSPLGAFAVVRNAGVGGEASIPSSLFLSPSPSGEGRGEAPSSIVHRTSNFITLSLFHFITLPHWGSQRGGLIFLYNSPIPSNRLNAHLMHTECTLNAHRMHSLLHFICQ